MIRRIPSSPPAPPGPQQKIMSPAPHLLPPEVLLPPRRPVADLCARCKSLDRERAAAHASGDVSRGSDLTVAINRCCPAR
ncbi:hypothetical protein [Streptomyces catenulae]|uniref:Uncharacterized protein n=1 Tax=Streptomyces catenulae TaxID=66875 RepID=A0ABV2Z319_9ACTN|nr:hypothetical protein [Streptomyces catenulae]